MPGEVPRLPFWQRRQRCLCAQRPRRYARSSRRNASEIQRNRNDLCLEASLPPVQVSRWPSLIGQQRPGGRVHSIRRPAAVAGLPSDILPLKTLPMRSTVLFPSSLSGSQGSFEDQIYHPLVSAPTRPREAAHGSVDGLITCRPARLFSLLWAAERGTLPESHYWHWHRAPIRRRLASRRRRKDLTLATEIGGRLAASTSRRILVQAQHEPM